MVQILRPNLLQLTEELPASQISTTSPTPVMAGFGVYFTPNFTGNLFVTASLSVYNSTAGDGTKTQLTYGTGTAPSIGDTQTGTAFGDSRTITSGGGGVRLEVTMVGLIPALSLKKKYWFDTQWNVVTAGTGILYPTGALKIEELTYEQYH